MKWTGSTIVQVSNFQPHKMSGDANFENIQEANSKQQSMKYCSGELVKNALLT